MRTELKLSAPEALELAGKNGIQRAILHEAAALRYRDGYMASMVAAGKDLVAERIRIIAAARGTPMPNEVRERERWLDYRGPEWLAALKTEGRDVDWAGRVMQWDIDLEAARRRLEQHNEARAERHEQTKALTQQVNRAGGAPRSSSAPYSAPPKPRGVSKRELTDAYLKIGAHIKRLVVEDYAVALEILTEAHEALDTLNG